VTNYLIDVNVLQQFRPGGNANVAKWKATIDDTQIRISVLTIFEMKRGAYAKGRGTPKCEKLLAAIETLERAFAFAILPLGPDAASKWAETVQGASKDSIDRAKVAVAQVHNLTIVTRNIEDFVGLGVRTLNPFDDPPTEIEPTTSRTI